MKLLNKAIVLGLGALLSTSVFAADEATSQATPPATEMSQKAPEPNAAAPMQDAGKGHKKGHSKKHSKKANKQEAGKQQEANMPPADDASKTN